MKADAGALRLSDPIMSRSPRTEIPGLPMHVIQRGLNRCAIFLDDEDRHHYRRALREARHKHAVSVHAFFLIDNHAFRIDPNSPPPTLCSSAELHQRPSMLRIDRAAMHRLICRSIINPHDARPSPASNVPCGHRSRSDTRAIAAVRAHRSGGLVHETTHGDSNPSANICASTGTRVVTCRSVI